MSCVSILLPPARIYVRKMLRSESVVFRRTLICIGAKKSEANRVLCDTEKMKVLKLRLFVLSTNFQ